MFFCTLRDLVLYMHKDEQGFRKNQVRICSQCNYCMKTKDHSIELRWMKASCLNSWYLISNWDGNFIMPSSCIQFRCPIMCTMPFSFIMRWPPKPATIEKSSTCSAYKPPTKPNIYSKRATQRSYNRGSIQSTMCVRHSRRRHWRAVSAAKSAFNGLSYRIHKQNLI